LGSRLWRGRQKEARGSPARPSGLALLEVLVTLLVLAALVYGVLQWRPWERWGVQVYFVPIGEYPADSMDRLVAYCKGKFGLRARTLPQISPGPSAYDFRRRQFVAEDLIALMKRGHPAQAKDAKAILIGITRWDVYTREKPEFRFALAGGELPRFAVISSARMDPGTAGGRGDRDVLDQRLRKMVSKYIGSMYFKWPPSSNPKSVMYTAILSIEDLDNVSEDF